MALTGIQVPVFLLFSCIIVPIVGLGDSLTPLQNAKWVSDNQVFAFGFVQRSSQNYSLSIYYNLQLLNNTVIWTVNWGQTVSSKASIKLGEDGNLVLSDGGTQIWQTNTGSQGVISAKVSDTGALQLLDKVSNAVWQSSVNQSFTDTLLPGQTLPSGSLLVSEQGQYALSMQQDSNLVMYLLRSLAGGGDGTSMGLAYWASSTYDPNVSLRAVFDSAGNFEVVNASGSTVKTLLKMSQPTPQQMRLQFTDEGLLRLYGWNQGETSWTAYGQLPSSLCEVAGVCGPYGVCTSNSDQNHLYSCECPPGFRPVDNDTFATGCMPSIPFDLVSGTQFLELSGTQYSQLSSTSYYFENPATVATAQQCREACSSSFQCMGAQYSSSGCYLKTLGQIHSGNKLDPNSVAFLKVSLSASSGSNNSWTQGSPTTANTSQADHLSKATIVSITISSVLALALALSNVVWFYVTRKSRWDEETSGAEISTYDIIPGTPVKFSYRQLQEATNRFHEKLGGGGFGSVYKGVLAGGSAVAVKQLESLNQGAKQFQAEVVTIGAIHHINLVRLRGFCAEGSHKLLVYEFMANGSLDRYLFSSTDKKRPTDALSWRRRFSIAYGTAKAICYLHEECTPSIIHCDIKPENVLLDAEFSPKISDFGLAKLIGGDKAGAISTVRGTGGYMAPEWFSGDQITVKVDVYSYGIVLLEMISGRRNHDVGQRDSRIIYSDWAYGQLSVGNLMQMLDPRLKGQVDDEQVQRMAKVAFWCIQKDHNSRPSMLRVTQMLDGTIDVPLPPRSFGSISIDIPRRESGGNDSSVLLYGR